MNTFWKISKDSPMTKAKNYALANKTSFFLVTRLEVWIRNKKDIIFLSTSI